MTDFERGIPIPLMGIWYPHRRSDGSIGGLTRRRPGELAERVRGELVKESCIVCQKEFEIENNINVLDDNSCDDCEGFLCPIHADEAQKTFDHACLNCVKRGQEFSKSRKGLNARPSDAEEDGSALKK